MNKKILIVLSTVIMLMIFGSYKFLNRPIATVKEYKYINACQEPIQTECNDEEKITMNIDNGKVTLIPLANYKISAKVQGKKKYSTGWNSELSPYDFALAWGELIKPECDKYIKYSQSGRWYYYQYGEGSPYGEEYISTHSANNHIIPANENVLRAIKAVKEKRIIMLEGYLVNVDGNYKNGAVSWHSSLGRTDTGDGSCEVFYVKRVRIDNSVYE